MRDTSRTESAARDAADLAGRVEDFGDGVGVPPVATPYCSVCQRGTSGYVCGPCARDQELPTIQNQRGNNVSHIGYQRQQNERAAAKRGLKFYPSSHRYKLDGEWVPGVTTILGVLDKPAIPKWAAKSVAQYVATHREGIEHLWAMGERAVVDALKGVPWTERDQAGVRGTDVHDFAERILNGEEVEVPDHYVGHVESCLAFMEDWNITPVLVEQTVGHRGEKYAGKLDLVADSAHAPRAIFDWKTASSGIYKETAFQLVAYAFAEFYGESGDEKPLSDLGIEESYGVHIRADGYDVYPLAFGPDVFDEFLCIRRAFDINKRANGDWKVAGSGYVGVAHQLQKGVAS